MSIATVPVDLAPTWPGFKQLRVLLDQFFALAPQSVQQYEVAILSFAVILFRLHLSQAQIASYAALGLAIYLGARAIYGGLTQIAHAIASRPVQE